MGIIELVFMALWLCLIIIMFIQTDSCHYEGTTVKKFSVPLETLSYDICFHVVA